MQDAVGGDEQRGEPVDQKAAGIDDPRMHQGGHGRRSAHGVGQPGMQQELGRAGKGREAHQGGSGIGEGQAEQGPGIRHTGQVREDVRQRPGAEGVIQQACCEQQRQVAEAVGQQRPGGITVGAPTPHVVTEQEIQQYSDQVPCDQERDQISRAHHQQQRGRHQVQQDEEARVAGLLRHVTEGIDVDDQADRGHDEGHQGAQWIEEKHTPGNPQTNLADGLSGKCRSEQQGRDGAGGDHAQNADADAVPLQRGCGQVGCDACGERQQEDDSDKPFHQLTLQPGFGSLLTPFRLLRTGPDRASVPPTPLRSRPRRNRLDRTAELC